MLTHQVKVSLESDIDSVLTRLSRRDSGAKGALIRRISLAGGRSWERTAAPTHPRPTTNGPRSIGCDVAVKVLFSEADIQLLARMAESEGVTVSRCIRRMVVQYVQRITLGVRTQRNTESRIGTSA